MNQVKATLESEILNVEEDIIKWRRHIHENPELSHMEYETKKYVENILKDFDGMEVVSPTDTSIIGILKGDVDGNTIGFKTDMDALRLNEEVDIPFKSKKPGIMHACGHDAHVAMLLGAAKVLSNHRDKIKGTIKFIFQHAEEVMPGGELDIINGRYVDDVDMILCIHTNPLIKAGVIATKPGVITAAIDRFSITVKGKGGHASRPQETINPVVIGSEIVSSLQNVVSRKVSPYIPQVLSITQFDTFNEYHSIIPDEVKIGGCVRSIDDESRYIVKEEIESTVGYISKKYNGDCEINYRLRRNSIKNDDEVYTLVERLVKEHFSVGAFKKLEVPYLIGDSFSAFSSKIPGCFISLGVGNEEIGAKYHSHSAKFKIDESALLTGTEFFVLFAFKISMELI